MLGGILLPVADRPSAVATGGEGEPAAAARPRAGEANGRGAVRLVEEHGATVVGQPEVLALAGGRVRPRGPVGSRSDWIAVRIPGGGGVFQVQPVYSVSGGDRTRSRVRARSLVASSGPQQPPGRAQATWKNLTRRIHQAVQIPCPLRSGAPWRIIQVLEMDKRAAGTRRRDLPLG